MARKPKKVTEPAINPNRWDMTNGSYLAGRSLLDEVDNLAAEMETFWGCDRLRLLVSSSLREKFDRQRFLLNSAIQNGTLQDIQREVPRMVLAWNTLNNAAVFADQRPLAPYAWEVTLEDGTVAVIVRDATEAKYEAGAGRQVVVYTLAEIGRLLSAFPALVKAKEVVPGATVTKVSRSVTDPLDGIAHGGALDDPLFEGLNYGLDGG